MRITTTTTPGTGYFETAQRPNGSPYVRLRDTAPDWIRNAVYRAHDGEAPNDWRYATAARIVWGLREFGCVPGEHISEEVRHHITDDVDYAVAASDAHVLTWAADMPGRAGYAVEYFDLHGSPAANGDAAFHRDPLAGLRVAMYHCLRGMVDELADAWEDVTG